MINTAVIGLGSNINPEANIQEAKNLLSKQFKILTESRFLKTKPVGFKNQPDFVNGALLIETDLDEKQLKGSLKRIETALGRKKHQNRYGPRTIDLDILVWNKKIISQDFYFRSFIKKLVLDLVPDLDY